ncbi:MAG: phenylacetate--CoA ligase family protein, partial [Casimicrobium sp.]
MHFPDPHETRSPEQREADLFARLSVQIAHAQAHAPAVAKALAGVDASKIASRAALAQLPVCRQSELFEAQKANRPFGGYSAIGWGNAARRAERVFASPGPIY